MIKNLTLAAKLVSTAEWVTAVVSSSDAQNVRQSAAASEEVASSSEELASQAEQLQSAIAFFKVDGSASGIRSSWTRTPAVSPTPAPTRAAKAARAKPAFPAPASRKPHKASVPGVTIDLDTPDAPTGHSQFQRC